jgi:two-component system, NtrC family, response regulator HydG
MTRVLIVDDDSDHAESLADVIEMRGHTTQLAHSGEEALGYFREDEFDFVLLDVKLPGINGVETFLEMVKIRPSAQVMMMTGYSVEQLVEQAIEGGALGVLQKPFAAMEVLELLSQVKPRGRVLVADDDAAFVESVAPVLEAAGYAVEVAATGAEALEKMMSRPVDCLVLDMRLPVLSGAELYARLVKAGHAMPTVLVTGGHDDAEQDPQLRPQIRGMLFKPVDPNALLTAIGSAVARRKDGVADAAR